MDFLTIRGCTGLLATGCGQPARGGGWNGGEVKQSGAAESCRLAVDLGFGADRYFDHTGTEMRHFLIVGCMLALLTACGSSVEDKNAKGVPKGSALTALKETLTTPPSVMTAAPSAGTGVGAGSGAAAVAGSSMAAAGTGAGSSADVANRSAAAARAAAAAATARSGPIADPRTSPKVIYFDYNSSEIKPEGVELIDAHARFLNANKTRQVSLEGHADERSGSSEFSLALSKKRAEAVRTRMRLLGVTDIQMEAVSFGKEKLAAAGNDDAAHTKNRRAEINYAR